MKKLIGKVTKLMEILVKSKYAVVLTGPGITAEYDSSYTKNLNNRLMTMLDPEEFTIGRYKDDPESFYDLGAPFFSMIYETAPNEVHLALAELEKQGLIKSVITQNVDGLQKVAGSKKVFEIHGTIKTASCTHCNRKVAIEDVIPENGECELPLHCPDCGEPLKPDVRLHGEPLPEDFYKAKEEARRADLMIIIGSAIDLSPDNELPAACKNIVTINAEPTVYDGKAILSIQEKPVLVLKLLLEVIDKRDINIK
ncbi:MAG: Sir2 family NAD-dependent protein deacetylase [Bacillota bacterium]|nr:NAD-dependent deacetylase [Bacillota bacterium]MDW7729858.1 Sir2 family NAD-dependent protein deacetylase [Bacillota bacterium]